MRRWRDALFCLLITAVVVVMQYRSGAFRADVAADPDEPPNAVSSVMVRDYLTQAFPHSPIAFAKSFYAHYPKVAIGHWPPLFHVGEALWMLLFGRNRVALLLFVALCTSALLCSVFLQVQRRTSTAAALFALAIMLHPRIFHEMLVAVRPDMLLALLVFWGAFYCGEYMRAPSSRTRNIFCVLAFAALMVHQRGGVLLLLPFFLLPIRPGKITWKWPVAGFAILLISLLPAAYNMSNHITVNAIMPEAEMFVRMTVLLSSWLAAVLALVSIKLMSRGKPERPFWLAMGGLVICGLAFYLLVPVPWEERYLISTLQGVAVLAAGGGQFLLDIFAQRRPSAPRLARRILPAAVATAALAWMLFGVIRMQPKLNPGYRLLVANCLLCGHDVTLVDGDAIHEGALIAEASFADPLRHQTVLRASKTLAYSSWSGYSYQLLFSTPADVLNALDRNHVSLVVLQDGYTRPEILQLRSALETAPTNWAITQPPVRSHGVTLYQRLPPPQR